MIDTGRGIGRSTPELEIAEREQILERYEARAKKGKGGTHQGRKKKETPTS